jgi:hypothetical protein
MTIPRAYATVTGPTATFTTPDGHTEPLVVGDDEDIRRAIVQRTAEEARRTGESVELVTAGDRGNYRLLITTSGEISPAPIDTVPTPATPATDSPGGSPSDTLRRRIPAVQEELETDAAPPAARAHLVHNASHGR